MTATQKLQLIDLPPEVVAKFKSITDIDERNEYIKQLRALGWTLSSIAVACGTSRERVRQIIVENQHELPPIDNSFPLPTPPLKPTKEPRVYVEPSAEVLKRLLELQPLVQQIRSHATRYRAEAEEYNKLLDHANRVEGVTLYRLAKRLGVTHSALNFRLVRYGYRKSENGKSKVYKPIMEKNRVR